ncbi:MAG: phosphoesterase [Terriglobia bacterium]|jgi:hypothetical protein
MRVRVCFHDQCFDGACSAAIFTRFYRERVNSGAQLDYTGMRHRAGQLFDPDMFDGDENAIVDFKYSSSDRLTWWFDHHQSAFLTEADAAHFRRDTSGKKFYGPDFHSCTKFIAHIGATKFDFHPADLQDLIEWADIVDGALYPDPKTAVEMRDPATQLTLVIEGTRSKDFVPQLIPELASKPLAEVAALPDIRRSFDRLFDQHLKSVDVVRAHGRVEGGVIVLDTADGEEQQTFNKFIPYYLFPDSVYSVALSRSRERIKVGVGSNPWNPTPKTANLASICERYGGGGHAKVAAISLPPDAIDRAREVARQITRELQISLEKQ